MKDKDKIQEQLIHELIELRRRIAELEALETQCKQAEEALRKAEQERAAILDSMSEHVVFQDLEHRVIWANKAAGESVGLTPEQLAGRHCYEIWQKSSKPCIGCPVAKTRETGQAQEAEMTTPEGRVWLIRGYPIKDANGNVVAMVEFTLEITQRKRAEEELRKYRERLEELVKERTAELTTANEELQREITQRKRTEEALRKAEQEKAAILDSMSEFVVYQDKEMNILWANKAASESVGLAPGQLVGRYCYEIWHQRSKPCVECPVIKARKTGQIHQAEVATPDGSVGFVRAYPLRDENGEVSGVVEVVLDITRRKRAEEALQESERRYRTLLENLPQKIFHKDKNSVYISCNENLARDLKIKPNEITGKTDYDLVPKELAEKYRADDKRIIESGKIEDIEERYIQDGKEVIIHTVKTPIKDEKGNIVGILGIFWDITERKRTEEALQESEKKYRELADLLPQAVFEVDEKGKIKFLNRKALEFCCFTQEDLEKGLNALRMLIPEDRDRARKNMQRRLSGEKFGHAEYTALRKDGSTFPVIMHSVPIVLKDKVVGLRGVVVDITERKQAEEKILQYQEQLRHLASELSMAEERERRRIATDLHDYISQALAVSNMKLGALREVASTTDLATPLDEIHKLIKQTIEYTRWLTFELSPPILYELGFEQAVEWLIEQMQEKHGFLVDFEDDNQPKPMDGELRIFLFKMVRELLINVAKHAKARNVKVSILRDGNNIRINVEDDGVGFDTSKIDFRLGKNSGFGLFNIRERLDFLGGHLELESEPGHGTWVSLVVPLKHKKQSYKRKLT